ncbi:MAG: hypothetical protein CSA07_01585 [Bacteroidia bacterium]|nr:MAG: hypothetical protein CSA07_01585 [Bacteroidia bacterium]
MVYEYQDWVQSLMLHMQEHYKMPCLVPKQRFCNYHLQTYETEYYFGYKECAKSYYFDFSVLLITDSGWHKSGGETGHRVDRRELDGFVDAEKADSVLIFYVETNRGKRDASNEAKWAMNIDSARDCLLRGRDVYAEGRVYARLYPMECFATHESTSEALEKFREGVKEHLECDTKRSLPL